MRGLPPDRRIAPPALTAGLHIVAVPSNPLDPGVLPLNIDGEWQRLKEVIQPVPAALTLERTCPNRPGGHNAPLHRATSNSQERTMTALNRHMPRSRPRWPMRVLLLASILLASTIWWTMLRPWAIDQTQTTHAIWRGTLPGLDMGVDAHAPHIGKDGLVEFWIYPHWADDAWFLLRIPGAPALPAPPEWVTAQDAAQSVCHGVTEHVIGW